MRLRLRILIFVLAAAALLAQRPADREKEKEKEVAEKNPFDSAADAELGRKYFLGHCALCHGPEGEGGRGVNLTTGRYRHGGSDKELFLTIWKGIPGSEMPPFRFSDNETWRVVAFVKRLGTAGADEKASGDAAAGKTVYEKAGCAQCHAVDKQGGALGPQLSEVGLRRSVKFLHESLVDPSKSIGDNYRAVTVVTQSGEQIPGIKLNEDDYSIQIRDMKDNARSFLKKNLREVRKESKSLMPAYGTILSATDVENLVAYLSSLRGKQS